MRAETMMIKGTLPSAPRQVVYLFRHVQLQQPKRLPCFVCWAFSRKKLFGLLYDIGLCQDKQEQLLKSKEFLSPLPALPKISLPGTTRRARSTPRQPQNPSNRVGEPGPRVILKTKHGALQISLSGMTVSLTFGYLLLLYALLGPLKPEAGAANLGCCYGVEPQDPRGRRRII